MAAGYPKPYQKQEQMAVGSKAKPYQKPHQKDKQWVQPELPFNDKPWREQPLTSTEIEELFWRELVQLGWRIHTYPSGGQDRKNIVLPCPDCNKKIDLYPWDWVSRADAGKMSSSEYVNERIKDHQADCKGIPEDELEA